ncbi:MAG: acyl-ACP--UDP-N-acetylglucosamine O-acyltransferase [Gammaproteobacteria bacterium]
MYREKDRGLIHPTAIVDPAASVDTDVEIGPYSVIGPEVQIGQGTRIGSHVVLQGPTQIGSQCEIFQFASIGDAPQDKKYTGEPTRLVIGQGNTIREYVTINRGTVQDEGVTEIGDHNWIMAYVHIAHDCRVGNHTVFANNATLAGHVQIGDYVVLGGATLIHQFCRIGEHAFTAYASRINKDVPPFITVSEGKSKPCGLNSEGLRRRGFTTEDIQSLKDAYRVLYRSDLSLEDAIINLKTMESTSRHILTLRQFLESGKRSIIR